MLSHIILRFLTFKTKFLLGVVCPKAGTVWENPSSSRAGLMLRRAGHHQAPQPVTRSWSRDVSTRSPWTITHPPTLSHLPLLQAGACGRNAAFPEGSLHPQKKLGITVVRGQHRSANGRWNRRLSWPEVGWGEQTCSSSHPAFLAFLCSDTVSINSALADLGHLVVPKDPFRVYLTISISPEIRSNGCFANPLGFPPEWGDLMHSLSITFMPQ